MISEFCSSDSQVPVVPALGVFAMALALVLQVYATVGLIIAIGRVVG